MSPRTEAEQVRLEDLAERIARLEDLAERLIELGRKTKMGRAVLAGLGIR